MNSKKLNPIVRVIPIIYENLPDEDNFLDICKKLVKSAQKHPLLKHYKLEIVLDTELIKYSPYLTKGVIPPKESRYNSNNGWLTVDSKIRARLPLLRTDKNVSAKENVKFPAVDEGDILLAISASGNSMSVVKAVEYANEIGGTSIGFVGFQGGKLKDVAKLCLFTPNPKGEYGPIEDLHLILAHLIVSYLVQDKDFIELSTK